MSRKAQPDCLRYFLSKLSSESSNSGQVEELTRLLVDMGNYEKSLASETVQNALKDGLLKPVLHYNAGSSRVPRLLRLPKPAEIMEHSSHDFYCFECHLPGALTHCRQCPRSFHRLCYRKDSERPNYTVPSGKFQKNRPPAFSSDTDADSDADETLQENTSFDYESDVRVSSSLLQIDTGSTNSGGQQRFTEEITVDSTSSPIQADLCNIEDEVANTSNAIKIGNQKIYREDFETESKTKVEVVCMGEIRPPTRKRPRTLTSNVSYKSEICLNEELESDLDLCTCCRLLKTAELRHPPNMQPDELSYLINFTFERNRTWVENDVQSYLESIKLPVRMRTVVSKLLFKFPETNLESIAAKLKDMQYNLLTEFFVDILDLQHNIGVFFGPNSMEMEATKWMVRDIGYDMAEIRRCPDCFRHSHEKHSNVWFAKPCIQRHELVFAKHSGFTYWPAKVIRLLPNKKYDVRFFGGNHSRALIESRLIRPIDTDIKSLKIGNKPAIKKALEELRIHQVLSAYQPSIFSFHANKTEMEEIIRNALQRTANQFLENTNKPRKPLTRRQTICNVGPPIGRDARLEITDDIVSLPNVEPPVLSDSGFLNDTETRSRMRRSQYDNTISPKRLTRSANTIVSVTDLKQVQDQLDDTLKVVAATQKKNEKLLANVEKLKASIKKHEHEKKILKRKQWCYWCLNEAIYLCCFRAAYCSQVCQSRHWKDGHSKVCRNQTDQRQASSTT
ncbi:zinc finger MYND domain-containing protein 11 isoform X1 [Zeugodacus cucurbitae]|uniref:zinc finger MYND domain-containing protein 11 isoform X1 n=1 Tax=Zeugodacus cucurbitae TaxID=28588 RepID=UPI0005967FE5|nr:zinc finger MYND domain-containing protein 11 isoform X1 [Zeugodacus cucurbitae]